ncbi:hypothetical protein B9Z55_004157 [Caenorhabditis nigoni]|uniref:Uncharacterized protein n=1 Tax=Caenorhabditis nigoni TaxID=1611254 RepID=A0A2G5UV21_9PELO|nr:hypothetical protein B9Z55_004157 [Caenorhabditis nigoni]
MKPNEFQTLCDSFQQLRKLEISFCKFKNLNGISKLANLQVLVMVGIELWSKEDFMDVFGLKNLRVLDMGSPMQEDFSRNLKCYLECEKGLPELRFLDCCRCAINVEDLENLVKRHPKLEMIGLIGESWEYMGLMGLIGPMGPMNHMGTMALMGPICSNGITGFMVPIDPSTIISDTPLERSPQSLIPDRPLALLTVENFKNCLKSLDFYSQSPSTTETIVYKILQQMMEWRRKNFREVPREDLRTCFDWMIQAVARPRVASTTMSYCINFLQIFTSVPDFLTHSDKQKIAKSLLVGLQNWPMKSDGGADKSYAIQLSGITYIHHNDVLDSFPEFTNAVCELAGALLERCRHLDGQLFTMCLEMLEKNMCYMSLSRARALCQNMNLFRCLLFAIFGFLQVPNPNKKTLLSCVDILSLSVLGQERENNLKSIIDRKEISRLHAGLMTLLCGISELFERDIHKHHGLMKNLRVVIFLTQLETLQSFFSVCDPGFVYLLRLLHSSNSALRESSCHTLLLLMCNTENKQYNIPVCSFEMFQEKLDRLREAVARYRREPGTDILEIARWLAATCEYPDVRYWAHWMLQCCRWPRIVTRQPEPVVVYIMGKPITLCQSMF